MDQYSEKNRISISPDGVCSSCEFFTKDCEIVDYDVNTGNCTTLSIVGRCEFDYTNEYFVKRVEKDGKCYLKDAALMGVVVNEIVKSLEKAVMQIIDVLANTDLLKMCKEILAQNISPQHKPVGYNKTPNAILCTKKEHQNTHRPIRHRVQHRR